ncbi:hypothetical protein Hanom_Chr10g00926741 [Helianthus anomalus]
MYLSPNGCLLLMGKSGGTMYGPSNLVNGSKYVPFIVASSVDRVRLSANRFLSIC